MKIPMISITSKSRCWHCHCLSRYQVKSDQLLQLGNRKVLYCKSKLKKDSSRVRLPWITIHTDHQRTHVGFIRNVQMIWDKRKLLAVVLETPLKGKKMYSLKNITHQLANHTTQSKRPNFDPAERISVQHNTINCNNGKAKPHPGHHVRAF